MPPSVPGGVVFQYPVYVIAVDNNNSIVPTFNENVTVILGLNPGNATIVGTGTVLSSYGMAVYQNLVIEKNATDYNTSAGTFGTYTLEATSGSLTSGTTSASTGFTVIGYAPNQILAAYGINAITSFQVGHSSVSPDGLGETIAIVVPYNDPTIVSDTNTFDSQYDLPSCGLTVFDQAGNIINPTSTTIPEDPTGQSELEAAMDVEWAHAIAPGALIDLIECGTGSYDLYTGAVTAASMPPVSVVSMSWGANEYSQQQEIALDSDFLTPQGHQGVTFLAATGDYGSGIHGYPAFSPNVVAVGGTTLTFNPISETGWSLGSDPYNTQLGGGGGISNDEAEPLYQQGVVLNDPSKNRATPDVSFDADPLTGVAVYDSNPLPGSVGPWQIGSGTSLGTPCWAGLIAIVDQGRALEGKPSLDGPSQTLPALYGLPSHDFRDITSGWNGGFTAGPGYDEVTGLGSPVANLLVPALIAYPFQFNPSSIPDGTAGTAYSATITVSGGTGNKTITYSLTSGTIPAGLTFTPSTNELAISGTPSESGSVSFTVTAIDANNTSSTANYSLIVAPGPISLSESSVSVASDSIPNGDTTQVTVQPKDGDGDDVIDPNLPIVISVDPGSTGSGTISNVTETNNGAYTATFTATSAGTITITAAINGQKVQSPLPSVTVTAPVPRPSVTDVSPPSGPTAGGTTVTITGTNLANATAVDIGTTAVSTFISDSATQIVLHSPAGTGTENVTVITAGGFSPASTAGQFTYVAAPTVTGVSPPAGPPLGGTTVTISGTYLANATAVDFGTTVLTSFISDTANQIVLLNPAGTGAVNVTVVTVGGTSPTSTADVYTYVAAPRVTGVSPAAGPVAGGTTVTISGTSLGNATAVDFGTAAVTSFISDTASQIVLHSPAGTGAVNVTVVTAGGTSSISTADLFSYFGIPSITQVSPASGPVAGGTTVTITGVNLGTTGTATIDFGTTPAAIISDNGNQIVATSPAGTLGVVNVTVTTAGGSSATSSSDQFTFAPPATITVTTTSDALTHTGTSLRDAIATANVDAAAGFSEVINFAAGLNGDTITLTQGQLELTAGTGTTTINGGSQITVDGGGVSRVFQIDSGAQAILTGLTIQHGNNDFGGAFWNAGTLTLSNSTFAANTATTSGGVIYNSYGTLTVATSTFSKNTADYGGVVYNDHGTLSLTNSTLTSNSVTVSGGVIYNTYGTITLTSSTLSTNAAYYGGVIYSDYGTLTLTNSTLSANTGAYGGAVNNWRGTYTVTNCILSTNSATDGGGAIANYDTVTVANSTISGNLATSTSSQGGGLYNYNGATLIVTGSNLTGNSATYQGGGIFNQGTLTVNASTLSGNSTNAGGGIENGDGSSATLTVTNSSLTGNTANYGGGIDNYGGTLTLGNSTIFANSGIGGGVCTTLGTLQSMVNTIVAGNTGSTGPDIDGSVIAGNNNLIGNSSNMTGLTNGTNGNQIGTSAIPINPELASLASNGGPTQTLALLSGSPAIAAGGTVTTLAAAVSSTTSTAVTVASAAALAVPPGGCVILVDSEEMLVTAVNLTTNTLTVQRGYNGTTPAMHNSGAGVFLGTDQRGASRLTSNPDIGAFQTQGSLLLVTTASDSAVHTGVSLRDAVTSANLDGAQGIASTISFAANLIGQTITLTNGELAISQNVTIAGPGSHELTISGNTASRVFEIDAGNVTISGLTISGGKSSSGGGGILNYASLTLSQDFLTANQETAGEAGGGAVLSSGGGSALTVDRTTISNNTATWTGGGISLIDGGVLVLTNSTINGNTSARDGGGITLQSITANVRATVINSTISNNIADMYAGGGILDIGYGSGTSATLNLLNSTIADNSAPSAGGVASSVNSGTATTTYENTLFAGNSNGNVLSFGGALASLGHNLSDDGTGSLTMAGDLPNRNPMLGVLQSNGGPTQTLALLPGSPAIAAGGAVTTLAAAVASTTSTAVTVATASAFAVPPGGCVILVDSEEMLVTAVNLTTNTLTVQRGYNGTTPAMHGNGAGVFLGADQRGASRLTSNPDIGAFQTQASLLLVTTASDSAVHTGVSLRDAVTSANQDGAQGIASTISFAGTVNGNPITLSQGQIELKAGTGTTTINGGNQITVDGGGVSRVFLVDSGAQVVLTGLIIQHANPGSTIGGGIENLGTLTVNSVTLSHNTASYGGGIFNYGGTLTVGNSTFTGNSASVSGGGLDSSGTLTVTNTTFSTNSASYGGAIFNNYETMTLINVIISGNSAAIFGGGIGNYGSLTVTTSTISGNSATGSSSQGGGIFNASTGTLTVNSSTLTGNSSISQGGGIFNQGTVTLSNSTIYANTSGAGGGIDTLNGSLKSIVNTIVAGNSGSTGPDIYGPVIAGNNNLVGNSANMTGLTNGTSGNLIGTSTSPLNPHLASLANNGGPTQTLALLPGSPAIDAGSNTGAPLTDQRGYLRISNNRIDIGAYEYEWPTTHFAIVASTTTPKAGVAFNLTVTALDASGYLTDDSGATLNFGLAATDSDATLPTNYTFGPADLGARTFSATLTAAGARPSRSRVRTATLAASWLR